MTDWPLSTVGWLGVIATDKALLTVNPLANEVCVWGTVALSVTAAQ
jgi:hypothetical protein